jgi:hypothetical protein
VPVKEASLPHGDTSGEEAESCEGPIRVMAKGVRENVNEYDPDHPIRRPSPSLRIWTGEI